MEKRCVIINRRENYMTKKKIMIPIMSIMLATSSMTAIPSLTSVHAAQAVQEAYTYQVETQEGKQYIVLTDYKGSEEKITIPDQINGIEVKSIQDGFGKNSKLKSITLSKNIASEKDTKRSLAGLNQITTLEEIQTVKDNAAYQSEDGILYTKDKKELVAYPKSKKSETYVMLSEVEKAGELSLANLKYLKNLTFSKKIKIIPECSNSSIENVIIPDQVKVIDESTFDTCKNLKKVTFGKNITTIGDGAFANCTALETIKLPNNLKNIEEVAFVNTSLKSVIIPDSVVKIGASAFDKDVKLKKPSYLKKIKKTGGVVYYEARATVKTSRKKTSYKAAKITKIRANTKKVTLKKGKKAKIQTKIFYAKKLKKGYLDPSILKFTTSNKKIAAVSKYGNIKGVKKGKATITVKLRTSGIKYKVNVVVK